MSELLQVLMFRLKLVIRAHFKFWRVCDNDWILKEAPSHVSYEP